MPQEPDALFAEAWLREQAKERVDKTTFGRVSRAEDVTSRRLLLRAGEIHVKLRIATPELLCSRWAKARDGVDIAVSTASFASIGGRRRAPKRSSGGWA